MRRSSVLHRLIKSTSTPSDQDFALTVASGVGVGVSYGIVSTDSNLAGIVRVAIYVYSGVMMGTRSKYVISVATCSIGLGSKGL
jgi:hypothetical protein